MGAIVIRTRYDEGTESAEVATSGLNDAIFVINETAYQYMHTHAALKYGFLMQQHTDFKWKLSSISKLALV